MPISQCLLLLHGPDQRVCCENTPAVQTLVGIGRHLDVHRDFVVVGVGNGRGHHNVAHLHLGQQRAREAARDDPRRCVGVDHR